MRARRALLYMPGDDMHKIRKATTLGVDCVCMDLEDGVAFNRKSAARAAIVEALQSLHFSQAERLVRINPVGSGLEMEDLTVVLPGRPDGVVIPKVNQAGQIRWVSDQLASAEAQHGWQSGSIKLLIIAESARGILNLESLCTADDRLQAIIFGAEDLANDLGAKRTRGGWEIFHARSQVILHTAAHGLQAIDMVYVDFKDPEGLKDEARVGAQMGFSGKQIIHPDQVEPVQQSFTPGEDEIERARRIIQAYEQHQELGAGAFAVEGKMIDAPIVKRARLTLTRAQAAGKL
jgi:citrate lyase beta subunit